MSRSHSPRGRKKKARSRSRSPYRPYFRNRSKRRSRSRDNLSKRHKRQDLCYRRPKTEHRASPKRRRRSPSCSRSINKNLPSNKVAQQMEKKLDNSLRNATAQPPVSQISSEKGGAKLSLITVAQLPNDVSVLAASFLTDQDVAMLSCCDVLHHKLGKHSSVWKMLFSMHMKNLKGAPKLTDQLTNKQWRLAYLLQRHSLFDRFRCAISEQNIFDGILGIPISYSRNPKTMAIDYISSSMDLLSLSAIRIHNTTKDVWGNQFDTWLPLYFTRYHFERALPHIQETIATLARAKQFRAEMILDVFPKIFCTFSVLLSDQGVAACEKTFQGFIAIHRLFLALVRKYKLAKEATRRLRNFMGSESERIKSKVPSLGNLIPLLLVVDAISWNDFLTPYMQESFDRNVLWACKAHPELATEGLPPLYRAIQTFDGAKVSLRHMLFQACFQRLFCSGSLKQRESQYDCFLPQPPCLALVTLEKFQAEMQIVMGVNSFDDFFRVIGMHGISLETLDRLLKTSFKNSLLKGYHSPHTNFAAIHASGTSRLLSQTHSCRVTKSNLTSLKFENTWNFKDVTRYLDSTCLLYTSQKNLVQIVDYRNRRGGNGALSHSGDIMGLFSGKHIMNIDLRLLPNNITTLVFVLSAWTGSTLKDILTPAVSFTNADSHEELCQYNLEAHNKQDHNTAVIMCKLYRHEFGQSWHVLAIGESCSGREGDYEPIKKLASTLL